jgi:hypothetical protein
MSTPTIQQLVSAALAKASDNPQDRAVLSSIVESAVRRTDSDITIVDGHGNTRQNAKGEPMSFAEFLDEVQRQRPETFSVSKPEKLGEAATKPAVIPVTPGMSLTDRMKAMRANQQASEKDRAAAEATKGNPWKPQTRNLSRQYLITNLNPELAAQLKNEAGVKS